VTITGTLVAFVSTSGGLVSWLDLAEALLVHAWHGVAAEIDGIARLPVIGFLGDSFPFSHFVESLNCVFGVWANS